MRYQSIVVLTGAGISAESGIRTFRASDGLWEDHRVEDVATPEGFAANPALVQNFYNQRRQQLLSEAIKPNAAHLALAEFEASFAGDFLLVTQNIDNLHEQAGSQYLLHMHGELLKSRCIATGQIYEQTVDIQVNSRCECCQQPGYLRPHVVWFNEMPLYLDKIYQALSRCDLFIAIGTSGNVYPAAGFFQEAKSHGATTVELNLDPSQSSSCFDIQQQGLATEVVPAFLNGIK
ncbi:NAD-dependent protein deacylase [Endozoicomonas sp. SM1973]|uniref:NAD-dependent protein deacylase n=1 Tax=Spartinivicinus marinus TaxID=2994442 RepID=A0A853I8U4_9GAMM|nr:Sir2 family NAD+-dependent deacetylase [Spartinivicinus marinus]MCX4024672.1 NAD-dependent protein deacylase [Spartinivicinus marinus]NYZ66301.1 NAD-dependent protein deacylase [Spartinivicinus marinus]